MPFGETLMLPSAPAGAVPTKNMCCREIQRASLPSISSNTLAMGQMVSFPRHPKPIRPIRQPVREKYFEKELTTKPDRWPSCGAPAAGPIDNGPAAEAFDSSAAPGGGAAALADIAGAGRTHLRPAGEAQRCIG